MSTLKNLIGKKVPRITRELKLGKFDESFEGDVMQVWVNVPPAVKKEYAVIQKRVRELRRMMEPYLNALDSTSDEEEKAKINTQIEELNVEIRAVNDEVFAWYGKVWGQPAEDVREFSKHCLDNGLAPLWQFVKDETWTLITMYLEGFEKN